MTLRDGGPAFPCSNEQFTLGNPTTGDAWAGLSLRDWFAGQAMASVIGLIGIPEDGPDDLWDASIAERTYALADAMIAARAS